MRDLTQKEKDRLKVSIGAPLAAVGGWAAYRGAPILKNKLTNVTDGEWVSNYLKFSENMLGKSYLGRKATKHHKNIVDGKPEASTLGERLSARVMIPPKKNNNFMSKHYTEFAKEPKDALKFWKSELKHNKIHRGTEGKTDPKTLKRVAKKEENFEKDYKVFKEELEGSSDIHEGLKNLKKPESVKTLALLRAEKRQPGEVLYPSAIGLNAGLGVVGAGVTADGLRKKASKDKKEKSITEKVKEKATEHGDVAAPAALSAGLAATPTLRDKYLKGYEAKIDPKSKKLVIVTEGGKHNPGGGGHEAAARSISEQYDKIHGKGSSKVVNFTDYSRVRNKYLSKFNKNRYNGMTNPDHSKLRRGANMAGYILGFGPMRNTDKKKFQKDLQGAGRVITTQPDAVNFLRPLGIAPEVAVTDYGVGKGKAKQFWEMSYGLGPKKRDKDPNAITKAFTPSKGAKDLFSAYGTPTKDVPSVPISDKFMSKSKGKKIDFIDLADNEGNPTGKRIKLDPKKKLVVVTGGSTGLDVDSISNQLAESGRKDLQIVGISGKNKDVRKNIGKGAIAQGYEKNFDKLLDRADMVVARPHGISTTEALSKGKPVIPVTTLSNKDSYAPHMVGNAENFSKMQGGSPRAAIDEKGSIGKAINEVADNLGSYTDKAKETSKTIRQNAAKIIAAEPSSTKNYAYKMPNHLRGPIYLASGGAALVSAAAGTKKIIDKYKNKKSEDMKKESSYLKSLSQKYNSPFKEN